MPNKLPLLLLLSLIFFLNLPLAAQRDFGGGPPAGGPSSYKEENPDTAKIAYFYPDRLDEVFSFADTLLGNYFHQFDPIRYRLLDYAHLGIMGSPARPIIYNPRHHKGFEVGLNQYDLYHRSSEEFLFYKVNQAITDMYYSQGSEQDDGYFKLRFARNFAKGMHLSIIHDRIFHLVDETSLRQVASYLPQRTRLTYFGVGLWYHSDGGKYDGFFSFNNNVVEQRENGGITPEGEDLLLNDMSNDPFTVTTFLKDANTRYQRREYAYTHYYRLGSNTDTTHAKKALFTLYHKTAYRSNIYKYADKSVLGEESFYKNFLVDDRGIRHFLEHREIQNSFRIGTGHLHAGSPKADKQLLEVGMKHTLNWLKQEPLDSVFHTLFLEGRLRLSLRDRLSLKAFGQFGLIGNVGDYRLDGTLLLDLKKAGNFRFQFINQLYTPSLLQQGIFVSKLQIWNNDFKKPFETTLSATYSLPKFGLELTGKYHLLTNFIYYDSLAIPRQTGVPVSILQLIASKSFKIWKFHLDNVVVFQKSTEEFIQLPQIYSKHSFYFETPLFKRALLLRLGLDMRFNTPYFADAYHPLTGQFYLQRNRETPIYPATDAFLSVKVTRYSFRFFAKFENINSPFTKEYYWLSYGYPVPDLALRLGISWRLLN